MKQLNNKTTQRTTSPRAPEASTIHDATALIHFQAEGNQMKPMPSTQAQYVPPTPLDRMYQTAANMPTITIPSSVRITPLQYKPSPTDTLFNDEASKRTVEAEVMINSVIFTLDSFRKLKCYSSHGNRLS